MTDNLPNPAQRLFDFFSFFQQHNPNSTRIDNVLAHYFGQVEETAGISLTDMLDQSRRFPDTAMLAVRSAVGVEKAQTLCQWKSSSDSFFAGLAPENPVHHVASRLNGHHMEMLHACAIVVDVAGKSGDDEVSALIHRIVEFRQEIADMKLAEELREAIFDALRRMERAIVDHRSGVPDQDRLVMDVAYTTWRHQQTVKAGSPGSKQLRRLLGIIKTVLAFVGGVNSGIALVENAKRLLGE